MCAYVVMVVYICCKSLSPMFRLFFKCMLQASLFGCCLCFRTYVAGVLCGCYLCLQCFSSVFFKCFRRMFQVFICLFLYVASVASECFKSKSGFYKRDTRGKREGT
jgi:hypothetical protein